MLRGVVVMFFIPVVTGGCCTLLLFVGLVYRSERLVEWVARSWGRSILAVSGVRCVVEGAEYLDGEPRFFVCNHQSAIDIPVLMAMTRGDLRFIAKRSLFQIPIFGWVLAMYGFASIDRSSPRAALVSLKRMLARIQKKPVSYAVFPEGTRSRDGRLLPFRTGTLKICQQSGLSIVPVAIDGTWKVKRRNELRVSAGTVYVRLGPPISNKEANSMKPAELNDRVRQVIGQLLGVAASRDDSSRDTSGLLATESL